MANAPVLVKPWERTSPNSVSPFPPLGVDFKVKALADRLQKNGAQDLWTQEDGAVESFARPSSTGKKLAGAVKGVLHTRQISWRLIRLLPRGPSSSTKKQKESPGSSEDEISVPVEIEKPSPYHLSKTSFDSFNVSPLTIKAIHNVAGFETMTVVQDATLPVILKDTCGNAWKTS